MRNMTRDDIELCLLFHINAINQIGDLAEYRMCEKDRIEILKIMDNLTEKLLTLRRRKRGNRTSGG